MTQTRTKPGFLPDGQLDFEAPIVDLLYAWMQVYGLTNREAARRLWLLRKSEIKDGKQPERTLHTILYKTKDASPLAPLIRQLIKLGA